jgi:Skp family chaperone for outer membrane proteins
MMSFMARIPFLAVIGWLAILAATADPALAQNATGGNSSGGGVVTNPIIVVVDTDRIRRETTAGRNLDAQAEKYGKALDEDNRRDEAALKADELALQQQRQSLPQDQFTEKTRAFEQRVSDAQRIELKRRQAFDKSFNAAALQLQHAAVDATHEVATARNADIVIVKQAVLFFNASMDVTQDIINLVNRRLPAVEFPPPKMEPDGPQGSAATPSPSQAPAQKLKLQ